jgi:hypothetical protein
MSIEKKRAFLICPVRGADQTEANKIVSDLESKGWDVHFPPRDTNQNDKSGYTICCTNMLAIKDAEMVFIYWDGKSTGSLFDAGMAFAFRKPITILSIPELTGSKSFQDMFNEWEDRRINSANYCTSGELWSEDY